MPVRFVAKQQLHMRGRCKQTCLTSPSAQTTSVVSFDLKMLYLDGCSGGAPSATFLDWSPLCASNCLGHMNGCLRHRRASSQKKVTEGTPQNTHPNIAPSNQNRPPRSVKRKTRPKMFVYISRACGINHHPTPGFTVHHRR